MAAPLAPARHGGQRTVGATLPGAGADRRSEPTSTEDQFRWPAGDGLHAL